MINHGFEKLGLDTNVDVHGFFEGVC
jgi:hypothetical protein